MYCDNSNDDEHCPRLHTNLVSVTLCVLVALSLVLLCDVCVRVSNRKLTGPRTDPYGRGLSQCVIVQCTVITIVTSTVLDPLRTWYMYQFLLFVAAFAVVDRLKVGVVFRCFVKKLMGK